MVKTRPRQIAFDTAIGQDICKTPNVVHKVKDVALTENIQNDTFSAARSRRIFTICGTKLMIEKTPAATPTALISQIGAMALIQPAAVSVARAEPRAPRVERNMLTLSPTSPLMNTRSISSTPSS